MDTMRPHRYSGIMTELKINPRPPVKAYLSYAQILSGILTDKDAENWFYTSFIQLYSEKFTTDSWRLLHFIPDSYYLLHDQYLYQVFHQNQELINLNRDNVTDLLCHWIEKGYYVNFYLNEYYLPGTQFYNKIHLPHSQFFYGFSREKSLFKILNYDERGEFTSLEIPFSAVKESFLSESELKKAGWASLTYQNPRLIKKTNPMAKYRLSLSLVIQQLKEYLQSTGPGLHSLQNNEIHMMEEVAWGIGIYENLILYLEKAQGTEFYPFHLLWEHKQIMEKRLMFLEKEFSFSAPVEVKDNLNKITRWCDQIRKGVMSLSFSLSPSLKNKIIKKITSVREKETEVLTALTEFLSDIENRI